MTFYDLIVVHVSQFGIKIIGNFRDEAVLSNHSVAAGAGSWCSQVDQLSALP